jgi:hypothetical protein
MILSPRGFYLIIVLENWRKFNATHYATQRLWPLSEWWESDPLESDRKLIMHANNARPPTARRSLESSEGNRVKTALCPLYSPDIAPSNFYLLSMSEDI